MGELVLLNRDQILAAQDVEYKVIDVPEWGGSVRVRSLSGSGRDQLEAHMTRAAGTSVEINTDGFANFRAMFVAMSIVDAEGNRIFTDSDVAALGEKSSKALQRVYNACMELSAVTEDDVKELVGNSGAGQNAGSGSASA